MVVYRLTAGRHELRSVVQVNFLLKGKINPGTSGAGTVCLLESSVFFQSDYFYEIIQKSESQVHQAEIR